MPLASKIWTPASFLPGSSDQKERYAVIVLNNPLGNSHLFKHVCSSANVDVIVAADGGGNRLYELHKTTGGREVVPNIVIGDLDSLHSDAKTWLKSHAATRIVKDESVLSTDFGKALQYIASHHNVKTVITFGSLAGRADHAFSQIHQLYLARATPSLAHLDIYLFTGESIVILLHEGENQIATPIRSDALGDAAGVIPISQPARITLKGFEWDVTDWQTEFGGQMSTSNYIRSDHCVVCTNERVIFSLELGDRLKPDIT